MDLTKDEALVVAIMDRGETPKASASGVLLVACKEAVEAQKDEVKAAQQAWEKSKHGAKVCEAAPPHRAIIIMPMLVIRIMPVIMIMI